MSDAAPVSATAALVDGPERQQARSAATPERPRKLHDAHSIAAALREAAALLAGQGANPFRIAAYRKAADVVDARAGTVRALFDRHGRAGLSGLPAIGPGIAAAIAEMLVTGRWSQLERLRGTDDPAEAFRVVPGVGPALSRRLHDELGADSLESLELAAHDGRLERVRGVGPRRAAAIRALITQMLGDTRGARRVRGLAGTADVVQPSVAMVLDVDREYRELARVGGLPTIAPRRFNPQGEAWLPVLHTRRGPWHFTALYSNSARAHELHREHDWVVVYAYDGDHRESQHTVVTETRSALRGRRVVRGQEESCRELYARAPAMTSTRQPEDAHDV